MIDTQAIRNKILDLAMRGELSEQLPEDGTAEELYQQIQAEKQMLIKTGKIKKEKPLPEIAEKEIPFEIPTNWKWIALGNITSKISSGNTPPGGKKSDVYVPNGFPLFREQNIYDDGIRQAGLVYISEKLLETRQNSTVKAKDILLNITGGSIGRCALVPDNFDRGSINQHILIIRPVEPEIRFYIHMLICGPYIQSHIKNNAVGDKDGFSGGRCKSIFVPLPPLAEQHRIVARIEQAFSALDTIDALQAKYADNLTVLKSKLIDAAIQGKLTEQLPEDGTAEKLYQQIQAERQRQEAADMIKTVDLAPDIPETEIPFTIPSNWKWTNLGNISYIVRGGSPRPIKQYITSREDGINWIKIGDVEKGGKYISSTHEKIIPEGEAKSRRVYPGDFLLTNSMSFGRPYISKIEGCIHDGWLLIHDLKGFNPDYLYYLLSSSYLFGQFTEKASGSTVDNLNIDKVKAAIIPLPPIAEQERIVARVTELLALCNGISNTQCGDDK